MNKEKNTLVRNILFAISISLLITAVDVVAEQTYMLLPIISVVDGDTIATDLSRLPIPLNRVKIRVGGIDTPEKNYLAKCEKERELGLEAKAFVEKLVEGHSKMKVENYSYDKYGGRIVADVKIGGKSVAAELINAGLAMPYDGKGPRPDWCN
jgi:endonuclease YncB( thermonuclease family)